jgi:demethylmenaquinone methyltransferase/2-methoxy-6-polyprenyl-1,4-benzoquinol methylase
MTTNELRAYFEELATRWDGLQPPDREERLRRLLAPFAPALETSTAVLELGTGTGALIPCLWERAPGACLVSVDLAGEMLRRARQRCPDAAVVQADAHRLPFGVSRFDLVVCHNCYPHLADKAAVLRGLARALRPGGHLLILHDLSRARVNAIHSSGGPPIQNDLLPPGDETGRMLELAGFTRVRVEDTDEHYLVAGRWTGLNK